MTWSPQTIGEDHPRPGTSAFDDTLIVVDHFVGRVSTGETARPAGPRNCGHVVSAGTGAPGTTRTTASKSTAGRRGTKGEYNGVHRSQTSSCTLQCCRGE